MNEESLLALRESIGTIIPIVVAIITWGLTRIKKPDYGKKDWKSKVERSAFDIYTIFLIITFILPCITLIVSDLLQNLYIGPMIKKFTPNIKIQINLYMITVTVVIYYFGFRFAKLIKKFLTLRHMESKSKYVLNVMTFTPIVLNLIVSIKMSVHYDLAFYSNITFFLLVFQIFGMSVLSIDKPYKYSKMKIIMKDGESILANVEYVSKKGKWLRIIEHKIPHKEKLIVFDDIKSIEYYN